MTCFTSISLHVKGTLGKLGRFVATYPKWIIIFSVASSLLLGLGMIKAGLRTDLEVIFAPVSCRAHKEERVINELFPMNRSYNYDYLRVAKLARFAFVIVSPKDNQTALRKSVFEETAAFDEMVKSIEVEWEGRSYSYKDVCAKNNGECHDASQVLSYLDRISQIEAKEIYIKYPVEFDLDKISMKITAETFGGVKTDAMRNLLEAKAIRLIYSLDDGTEISLKWEREFKRCASVYGSTLLTITTFASSDFETLSVNFILLGFYYGCLSFAVIATFSVLNSMTSDWVTSKPLLAVAGCLSPLLAIAGSTGLTAALGIQFTCVNIALVFIMIALGVDDMFILMSAWRSTNSKDSVVQRLDDAYTHAATPILMTSLTNFIAFSFGMTIPVPAIRIFSIHGAMAVVLDFVYQVTFFGGFMALDGYREEKKLHPLTFQPITPIEQAGTRSCLYQIFFTDKVKKAKPILLTTWSKDKLFDWISKTPVIITIGILFLLYYVGASIGSISLGTGIQLQDFFFRDSDEYRLLNALENYFTEYTYPVQLAFNATLDYSDRKVQRRVMKSIDRFHHSKFIQREELNWLRHHLFLSHYNRSYCSNYNLSEPKEFINCLRNEYFNHPLGRIYRDDVKFHEDGKHILASRFVLFAKVSVQPSQQKLLVEEMRAIADSLPFSATVQNTWWLQCEILFILNEIAWQSGGGTLAAIFLALTISSSKLSSAFVVMVAIISIEFGIVGYMTFLGVKIHPLSLLVLLLCVGISVDPCIHISYAFQESCGTYKEKLRRTLNLTAIPVLQGIFSTLLGVLCLVFVHHSVTTIFVKVIYLLGIISLSHAVFLLPLMHHFWDVTVVFLKKSRKRAKSEKHTSPTPQLISVISINGKSHI